MLSNRFAIAIREFMRTQGRASLTAGSFGLVRHNRDYRRSAADLGGLNHYRRTRDDFEAVRFEPAGFVIDLTGILTAWFGGISDSYRAANVKIWVCHPRDYDDRAVRAEHGSARQSLLPHSLYQETRLQVSLSPPTYWRADHRRAGGSVDSNRLVFVRQGAVRHRPRPLDHEYRWTLERRRETRDAAARGALSPARAIALGHEGSRPS